MNTNFFQALADRGATLITHIGLKNAAGVEISGGSYTRLPVTWADEGTVQRPSSDLLFNIPSGANVASWCGYSALTGGTDYGGAPVDAPTPTYSSAGTYELLAADTNFSVGAVGSPI